MRVPLVAQPGGQDRYHDRREIEGQVAQRAEVLGEEPLHHPAEEEQRNHVEQQVHPVGVDEAVRHQALVLPVPGNRRRPQDQPSHQRVVVEGAPGDEHGGADDGQGDDRFHERRPRTAAAACYSAGCPWPPRPPAASGRNGHHCPPFSWQASLMPRSNRHFVSFAILLLVLACAVPAAHAGHPLAAHAERTGYAETGRYDEVAALCNAFASAHPDAVRCFDFGTSPEGRPMKALAVTRTGALEPEQARMRNLPVVLVQGGIHPGEADGKDAGFLALREVLDGTAAPGVLEQLVWLFVPVFNVDGHERFEAWNRPNQRGPRESGWRATAQHPNLNRDYAKAD